MSSRSKYPPLVLLLLLFIFSSSCRKLETPPTFDTNTLFNIPPGFDEIDFPDDNEFTQSRWDLGKKLFYDPILSLDSSLSCGTCHKPELAFADDLSKTPGVFNRPGTQNAPSLANVAYHPYFTREGGVPTLEMQILVPIQEENEFGHNIVLIADQLKQIQEYIDMSQEAYNREPDAFVITRAIAMFERSLISGNSRYDQYQFQGNVDALNSSELRGMDLFFSEKTGCTSCHSGFNFTDYSFQNNGLYTQYEHLGRMRITGDSADLALFKIPSLRNVEVSAPYMHDGSFSSLEEVVDHYNLGGVGHFNQSELVRPLYLTEGEKGDIVAFLRSLSDYSFLGNLGFGNGG